MRGPRQQPSYSNIGALNQDYYSQCLQAHIEAIELALTEGLALPSPLAVELELDTLLRMDPKTRAQMLQMHGEMMKAMGEVMMKHGKAMEGAKP